MCPFCSCCSYLLAVLSRHSSYSLYSHHSCSSRRLFLYSHYSHSLSIGQSRRSYIRSNTSYGTCTCLAIIMHNAMDNSIIHSNAPFLSVRCTSLSCSSFNQAPLHANCLLYSCSTLAEAFRTVHRSFFVQCPVIGRSLSSFLVKGIFSVLLTRRISTRAYVGDFLFNFLTFSIDSHPSFIHSVQSLHLLSIRYFRWVSCWG
jgi:hypothetical protein